MKRFKTTYQFQAKEQKGKLFNLNSKVKQVWIEIAYSSQIENGKREFAYLGAVVKLVITESGIRVKPKWPHIYLPYFLSKEELTGILSECWEMEMEVEKTLATLGELP